MRRHQHFKPEIASSQSLGVRTKGSTATLKLAVHNRDLPTDSSKYTADGQLMPNTHKWQRIRLRRKHASKAWKALGDRLEEATDALQYASPGEVSAALEVWRMVALEVLNYEQTDARDIETLFRLAAVLMNIRDPLWHNHAYRRDSSTSEVVLAKLLIQMHQSGAIPDA